MRVLMIAKLSQEYEQIRQWLGNLGCDVAVAPNPKVGLRTLEADPAIDLVVVDGSSEKDVLERFLTNIRSNHRLNLLPCILAGADLNSDTVRTYISLGVQDVIILPTSKETLEAKIHTAVKNGKPSILVVDDEPAIAEILSDFLTLERCLPITAGTAEEADEILANNRIDLLISDIRLPGKDGLQLLVETKERYPGLPVILITGYAGKYSPKDAIAMGADGYFAKPFHNMDLIYTLRRVLNLPEARRRARALSAT